MLNIMPNFILLSLGLFASLVLCMFLFYLYQKERDKNRRLTQANPQKVIKEALKKSQAILEKAEAEGAEVIKDSRSDAKSLAAKYTAEMEKLIGQMESAFQKEVAQAEKDYIDYLTSLKEQSQKMQQSTQAITQKQTAELLAQEIAASREAIEGYKQAQLKVVDENILSMLEQTLSMVLAKKVSLEDELDLVYEALDKAKAEKFIV